MSETITVTINGDACSVPENLNVTSLLARLKLTPERVAIERNLQILPRGQWEQTIVTEGDRFEIVHLVGGG